MRILRAALRSWKTEALQLLMEFDGNIYDAKIPLCLSRFFSLPQTESTRFFFFSKDDERLRGIK